MKDYLSLLQEKFPIRRSEKTKAEFRDFVISEAKALGYDVKTETNANKHNNVVIGDVNSAKAVFTAHYDTPAASLLPNIMMPRNPVLGILYQFGYPLLLAAAALGLAFLIGGIASLTYEMEIIIFMIVYYSAYYLCTRCFDNKNNLNDNTSGVATVLSIMKKNKRQDVAFILFDNEEKGKLGSKAFSKEHSDLFKTKAVINLDCVGNGNHLIFICKTAAEKLKEYKVLVDSVKSNDNYNVYFYPEKGSSSNSDWKNFPCGISVMACKKASFVGFYTPRIHTVYDTVASTDNIEFITDSLVRFTENI